MAEPPDFRSIAHELAAVLHHDELDRFDIDEAVVILQRVWNARGAADLEATVSVRHADSDDEDALAAIRKLDR